MVEMYVRAILDRGIFWSYRGGWARKSQILGYGPCNRDDSPGVACCFKTPIAAGRRGVPWRGDLDRACPPDCLAGETEEGQQGLGIP